MSAVLLNNRQLSASFHAELFRFIPEDHLLRKINAAVDFSFVYEIVQDSYCRYYGRPANEPEMLFRLLFARQCVDTGLIKSKTITVDATLTIADTQRKKPLEVLQDAANRLRRTVLSDILS
jgi:hypothetical protein